MKRLFLMQHDGDNARRDAASIVSILLTVLH